MGRDDNFICLHFTLEEVEELLSRCLNSEEGDTPVFQQALLKLARASFHATKPGDLLPEKRSGSTSPHHILDDFKEAA